MEADTIRVRLTRGFGDSVALTAVLRHLRHYYPAKRVAVLTKPGREGLFRVLADEVDTQESLLRMPTHTLKWELPDRSYAECPSTYVERCLIEELDLTPIPELCGYRVAVSDSMRDHVRGWLATIPRKHGKLAMLNPRGVAMKDRKNIDDYQAAAIWQALDAAGYDVLLWDEHRETKLAAQGLGHLAPNGPPLFFVHRKLHAGVMAALVASLDLLVGVDSGPLHLASAVGTKAIGIWTRQSPLHCICPDETTTHLCLLPDDACEYERFFIHRPIEAGLAYFKAHYRHHWVSDFGKGVAQVLAEDV
jgi:ADP-heptose:LPS heptosyltransferase